MSKMPKYHVKLMLFQCDPWLSGPRYTVRHGVALNARKLLMCNPATEERQCKLAPGSELHSLNHSDAMGN